MGVLGGVVRRRETRRERESLIEDNTRRSGGRDIHRQDAADEGSLALVHAFLKRDEACCVFGRVFPRGSVDITSKDHSGPTASCRG